MYYIKEHYTDTLEVKQSKFIAHLVPYTDYESTLNKLQQEHPKARHFVTAYRYLNEYGQIVESSSDDGEPKGTSGKPSLMVLQGNALINTAVIIVRYFGGTKLGTGGLVRAYSDAVNLVIEKAELSPYKELVEKNISCDYTDVGKVEYACRSEDVIIKEKIFDSKVTFIIEAPKKQIESLLQDLDRIVTVKE
ncbi:MAG: YigZ family protein [Sulfurimonas sp.]